MTAALVNRAKPGTKWTREEALEWYAKTKKRLGRQPGMSDMVPYQNRFVRLFGSIAEFQAAAGDVPRKPGRPKRKRT